MDDSLTLPEEYFKALSLLALRGPVSLHGIQKTGVKLSVFYALKEKRLADIRLPDPNFLYMIPEDQRDCPMFSITADGMERYLLLKENRQQAADDAAKRKAEAEEKDMADRAKANQDRKEHFRHDWRIAVFEAVFGFILGMISDHLFDIVGCAVEIWRSVLLSGH